MLAIPNKPRKPYLPGLLPLFYTNIFILDVRVLTRCQFWKSSGKHLTRKNFYAYGKNLLTRKNFYASRKNLLTEKIFCVSVFFLLTEKFFCVSRKTYWQKKFFVPGLKSYWQKNFFVHSEKALDKLKNLWIGFMEKSRKVKNRECQKKFTKNGKNLLTKNLFCASEK